MFKKVRIILFILLAGVFCIKELSLIQTKDTVYSYSLEDFGEDESETNGEGYTDEENGTDLVLHDIYNHNFQTSLFYCHFHKSYTESAFNAPFFEIPLPPPELI